MHEVWSELVDLWPSLTEAERVRVLTSLVRRVEVKEKGRVLLDVLPIAGVNGPKFSTRTKWERGQDSNLRPSGHEPDELPASSGSIWSQRSGLSSSSPY